MKPGAQVPAVAVAELLRNAGALIGHAKLMMEAVGMPELPTEQGNAELVEALDEAEHHVAGIWGAMLPFAGLEYVEKLRTHPDLDGDLRASTALVKGMIFGKVLQCDRRSIEALIQDPEFSYSREAELILQLRGCVSGEPSRRLDGQKSKEGGEARR